ncbi:SIR2 family NAD-dependent protein deacylase [Halosegnis longus]|uniref:NAD-dependent protein deacetylase n=1 Tax=Halosegnis longus TaxID=2216012 RepID=A0AAJ4R904_9EURY|nr:Sir2 family NAD-dependent protein deacetylase [Halosegnis longus]RNJ26457.1 NAD-dependent protein deacetylase [Salella cibi]
MTDRVSEAAARLRAADSAVAFTGAGLSTASGIPDFRSDGGIWDRYDPMDFHIRRFERDPDGFWRDRAAMVAEVYDGHEPNSAHDALAGLEADGYLDATITQNVDGLHRDAGSDDPVEIHGTGSRVACRSCEARFDAEPYYEAVREGDIDGAPACPTCDGLLKPDVVLFGEQMPLGPLNRARTLTRESDYFLVAGSSLSVEPAASLPDLAADTGSTLVVVNLEATRADERAEFVFHQDVTDVLPALHEVTAEVDE